MPTQTLPVLETLGGDVGTPVEVTAVTGEESPQASEPAAKAEPATGTEARAEDGARGVLGDERSGARDEGNLDGGSGTGLRAPRDGSITTNERKTYRVVRTEHSLNAGEADVVMDGDPASSWSTEAGAAGDEAFIILDLGKRRAIRRVRWLPAAEGLSGAMQIEVSTNGKHWQTAGGGDRAGTGAWQERRLKQAVDARYVRLVFTNPGGESRLGGLAEVAVGPSKKAEAKRGSAQQERRQGKGTSGHKRAKAKKHHHGARDRKQASSKKKAHDHAKGKHQRRHQRGR
jgi:hypothetical protein